LRVAQAHKKQITRRLSRTCGDLLWRVLGTVRADDQQVLWNSHPDVWREHGPAHFHALYGEQEAIVDIVRLQVIRGALPGRALALVLEWAALRRDELLEDWVLCAELRVPKAIPPLE
jgi:hypothetical protein